MFCAGEAGRDIHVKRPDGKQAGVHPVEARLSGKDESYQQPEADDSRREAGESGKDAGTGGSEADFGRTEAGDGIQEESFGRKEAGRRSFVAEWDRERAGCTKQAENARTVAA